jgi:hypothetical protein
MRRSKPAPPRINGVAAAVFACRERGLFGVLLADKKMRSAEVVSALLTNICVCKVRFLLAFEGRFGYNDFIVNGTI